jgi:hypothetical protein
VRKGLRGCGAAAGAPWGAAGGAGGAPVLNIELPPVVKSSSTVQTQISANAMKSIS